MIRHVRPARDGESASVTHDHERGGHLVASLTVGPATGTLFDTPTAFVRVRLSPAGMPMVARTADELRQAAAVLEHAARWLDGSAAPDPVGRAPGAHRSAPRDGGQDESEPGVQHAGPSAGGAVERLPHGGPDEHAAHHEPRDRPDRHHPHATTPMESR